MLSRSICGTLFVVLAATLLTACAGTSPDTPEPTQLPSTAKPDPLPTLVQPQAIASTAPQAPITQPTQPTIPNTPTIPAPSPTPNPFAGYTVPELAARSYGNGDFYVVGEPEEAAGFLRYQIEYISDGLFVTGLMNIPYGDGPWPVIVVNHGYIDPAIYQPGLDSRPMGDFFAQHGYATIMPDYRGYAQSDSGPNPLRIGYAIDVLNLIESLHLIIGLDPQRVGVVGHSMGGGISTYVMVLSNRVDAVSLYGSMSADQAANWQHIHDMWSPGTMDLFAQTYGTPSQNPAGYSSISPINYLDRVNVPVNLHHGTFDDQVPLSWSDDLAARLREAGVETNLYVYPTAGHTFRNPDLTTFLLRDLQFFDTYVKGDNPDNG